MLKGTPLSVVQAAAGCSTGCLASLQGGHNHCHVCVCVLSGMSPVHLTWSPSPPPTCCTCVPQVAVEYHKRFDPIYSDARNRIRQLGPFSYYYR
jgi:hypothetical protein